MVDPAVESPRQRQIEDAASALFRERGYAATSVRDIARALDLQGASLYAHVASKEDVLWAIVVRAAERFESAVEPVLSSDAPAGEKLLGFCRAHVLVVAEDLRHATVFQHDWRHLSEPRREEVRRMRDRYEGHLRAILADGVASGELASADPALDARAILTALNGVADWYRPDGSLSADAVAERYAELFTRALAGARPESNAKESRA